MRRMLTLAAADVPEVTPPVRMIALGARLLMSVRSAAPRASRGAAVTAVIAIGVSCRRSSRLRAVIRSSLTSAAPADAGGVVSAWEVAGRATPSAAHESSHQRDAGAGAGGVVRSGVIACGMDRLLHTRSAADARPNLR